MSDEAKKTSYSRLAVLKELKEFEEKRIGPTTELVIQAFAQKPGEFFEQRDLGRKYGELRYQRSQQEQARFPRNPDNADFEFILETLVGAKFLTKDGSRYAYLPTNMYF